MTLSRWTRPLLLAVGLLVVASGVVAGLLLARPDASGPQPGRAAAPSERRPAPELQGEVLVPPPVRLADQRGSPVLVNFWASWCVPCRAEAPHLARSDETMRERATLVGVDIQDTRAEALAFVREFGWRFPNVFDPPGSAALEYGLVGLPTTFVIDEDGLIAVGLVGPQTLETLVDALEEVE